MDRETTLEIALMHALEKIKALDERVKELEASNSGLKTGCIELLQWLNNYGYLGSKSDALIKDIITKIQTRKHHD